MNINSSSNSNNNNNNENRLDEIELEEISDGSLNAISNNEIGSDSLGNSPIQPNKSETDDSVKIEILDDNAKPVIVVDDSVNQKNSNRFLSPIYRYFEKWTGIQNQTSPPMVPFSEMFWSWLGSMVGMGLLAALHYYVLNKQDLVLLIGSFAASAVLIYGAYAGPLSQPRNLIGGHLISAVIGVSIRIAFVDTLGLYSVGSFCAVAFSIVAMQLTRTLHPPGAFVKFIHERKQLKSIKWQYVLNDPKILLQHGYLSELNVLLDRPYIIDDYDGFKLIEPHFALYIQCLPTLRFLFSKYREKKAFWISLIYLTIMNHNKESTMFLVENIESIGDDVMESVLVAAFKQPSIEIIDYLYKRVKSYQYLEDSIVVIVENGQINALKYLYEYGHLRSVSASKILYTAVVYNYYELVHFIVERFPDARIKSDLLPLIAKNCDLAIYQMLLERGNEDTGENHPLQCFTYVIDMAAENNRLDTIKWLTENKPDVSRICSVKAMDVAATKGYLELVQYLHFNRSEGCSKIAMDRAAKSNHLEIVKFLNENRSEGCSYKAVDRSAKHGHFQMVKFLCDNRLEGFTRKAMNYAASNGHYEMVVYLYQWGEDMCNPVTALMNSAKGGHFEIFKFLFSKLTVEDQMISDRYVDKPLNDFLQYNSKEINRFLFDESYQLDVDQKDVDRLVQLGCHDSLRVVYQWSGGSFFNTNSMTLAIKERKLKVLKFINKNCPGIVEPKSIVTHACLSGDIDIIRYVLSKDFSTTTDNEVKFVFQLLLDYKCSLLSGHVLYETIELMIDKYQSRVTTNEYKIITPVRAGDIELVKLLYSKGIKAFDKTLLFHIANIGHIEIAKFFHDNGIEQSITGCLEKSIKNFEMFEYLYLNYPSQPPINYLNAIEKAIRNGCLNVVRYLHEHHDDHDIFTPQLTQLANDFKRAEIEKFLLSISLHTK
ncbi:hypothetical protein PPL_09866 [Heterostelium album PN500]|uniref:HPP transmembrane region domain-containing protein n=1 Tax=Heterostelium pallidum (strain ATCC 26659 / Pp 5 / PN500) TaxID=670386 RepID=D3BPA3_HETP5|nr:hypothetical protein PPL_09866 [Heterostelium album PN500]EFA77113.1 hypothetical protein PPL_09866 [Heterostelium album PN500]|eukprot:XP_020429242.1 hypothetical protein PPL_09866 [Heterostelium album PN500]